MPAEKLIPRAVEFYNQLRNRMMSVSTYEEAEAYVIKYAKTCYEENIPLHEAIYALVLMRRQMWLYAEFQAVFTTVVEHQQAVDSVTRTMRMMDNAIYKIIQHYQELKKS